MMMHQMLPLLAQLFWLHLLNAMMLVPQFVLKEPDVFETMLSIRNVVQIVQPHGLVKPILLVSSNNAEV